MKTTIPINVSIGVLLLVAAAGMAVIAWMVTATMYSVDSSCTVVSYAETMYQIAGEDRVRVKICVFEETDVHATACVKIYDGIPDPDYERRYALGTMLQCTTAPARIYYRITSIKTLDNVSVRPGGWNTDPMYRYLAILPVIPLVVGILYVFIYREINGPRIHKIGMTLAGALSVASAAMMFVSLFAFAVPVERECEVTHSWARVARSSAVASELLVCARERENFGCALMKSFFSYDDVPAELAYYAPGTMLPCITRDVHPMNKVTRLALLTTEDTADAGHPTWIDTIVAVPSANLFWALAMMVCMLVTIAMLIVMWLMRRRASVAAEAREKRDEVSGLTTGLLSLTGE